MLIFRRHNTKRAPPMLIIDHRQGQRSFYVISMFIIPMCTPKPSKAPISHHHEVSENRIRQVQDHGSFDKAAEDAQDVVYDSDHREPGEYVE